MKGSFAWSMCWCQTLHPRDYYYYFFYYYYYYPTTKVHWCDNELWKPSLLMENSQRGRCIVHCKTGSQPDRGRCIANRKTESQPQGQMYCESQYRITATQGQMYCESQDKITATRADVLWIARQDHSHTRGRAIGTKKAFAGGYEYNYCVADDINVYVCDHQTTTKLSPGLVIRFLVLHVKWHRSCLANMSS